MAEPREYEALSDESDSDDEPPPPPPPPPSVGALFAPRAPLPPSLKESPDTSDSDDPPPPPPPRGAGASSGGASTRPPPPAKPARGHSRSKSLEQRFKHVFQGTVGLLSSGGLSYGGGSYGGGSCGSSGGRSGGGGSNGGVNAGLAAILNSGAGGGAASGSKKSSGSGYASAAPPFSPYVGPRFPHMSEMNSLFSFVFSRLPLPLPIPLPIYMSHSSPHMMSQPMLRAPPPILTPRFLCLHSNEQHPGEYPRASASRDERHVARDQTACGRDQGVGPACGWRAPARASGQGARAAAPRLLAQDARAPHRGPAHAVGRTARLALPPRDRLARSAARDLYDRYEGARVPAEAV